MQRVLVKTGPDVYSAICPSRDLLSRLGDKWSALVIGILAHGTARFGALKREASGISQKMLTQTLRQLERDGLIRRELFAEVPPRVEYSLTALGESVVPVLMPLLEWAEVKWPTVKAAQKRFDVSGAGSA